MRDIVVKCEETMSKAGKRYYKLTLMKLDHIYSAWHWTNDYTLIEQLKKGDVIEFKQKISKDKNGKDWYNAEEIKKIDELPEETPEPSQEDIEDIRIPIDSMFGIKMDAIHLAMTQIRDLLIEIDKKLGKATVLVEEEE